MSVSVATESALRSSRSRGESTDGVGCRLSVAGVAGGWWPVASDDVPALFAVSVVGGDAVVVADAGGVAVVTDAAGCGGWFGTHQYFHPAKPPPASKAITKNATTPGWPSERRGARAGANGLGVIVGRRGATAGTCCASRERGRTTPGSDARASTSPRWYPPASTMGRSESALCGDFICVSRLGACGAGGFGGDGGGGGCGGWVACGRSPSAGRATV